MKRRQKRELGRRRKEAKDGLAPLFEVRTGFYLELSAIICVQRVFGILPAARRSRGEQESHKQGCRSSTSTFVCKAGRLRVFFLQSFAVRSSD